MNKIPEGYDLRKILETLLDDLSHNRPISDMEVRRIIAEGNPEQRARGIRQRLHT